MEKNKSELVNKKGIPKPNNVFVVPTSEDDFFKWWCIFLRPFVKLTDREIDIISCFLKQREELARTISDPVIVDTLLMGNDIREKIIKECGITPQHFYVVLSNLRKHQIIVNNRLNPRLIPNRRDDGVFQLMVLFKKASK